MRFGLDVTQHQLGVGRDRVAREARRGRRVRRRVGVRSLQGAVRGPEGPVPRGVDAARRARARDVERPAGDARHRHDAPDPVGPGGRGRDGRSSVGRSRGVRRRRGVERARASRARDPVPLGARSDGPARRGRAGPEAPLHPGRRDVRRQAGPVGSRHLPAAARAATASADLDRWLRTHADAADDRPIRGRVARGCDGCGRPSIEDGDHRPRCGGSGPRPGVDPAGVEPVDQRAVGRGEAFLRVEWSPAGSATWSSTGRARAAGASRSSSNRSCRPSTEGAVRSLAQGRSGDAPLPSLLSATAPRRRPRCRWRS